MGRKPTPIVKRLIQSSRVDGECLVWTKGIDKDGYGKIKVGSRTDGTRRDRRAHVVAWEFYNESPVPDGYLVLHTCDNPPCIKRDHLYVGTPADNGRDMSVRKRSKKAQQTHCLRGHEFNQENTIVASNGTRHCRECGRRRARHREGS